MYRRFLNDNDYLGVIPKDALEQMTRGNVDRIIQAEESAEMSVVEYLSENYAIEAELAKGKYIAEYDRRVTFPVGAHFYLDGQICEVIRSISGYKEPLGSPCWEESSDSNVIVENIPIYSQFKTYYPGDRAVYNGVCYDCLKENGWKFGKIRIPMVSGWLQRNVGQWQPTSYPLWAAVAYNGSFYVVISTEGFNPNLTPEESDNWGEIADYDPSYNNYELVDHEYVVYPNHSLPEIHN